MHVIRYGEILTLKGYDQTDRRIETGERAMFIRPEGDA